MSLTVAEPRLPTEEAEAFETLLARARKRTGKIPPEVLVRHVLAIVPASEWPVRVEALDALFRRLDAAHEDRLRIEARPPDGRMLGLWATRRPGSGARPYRTVLVGIDPIGARCDCPDFLRNSLGLCKHALTVLEHVHARPRLLQHAVKEQEWGDPPGREGGGLEAADIAQFGVDSAGAMTRGWLLVPLTDKFAFISPSLLVIVMPLLAIVPLLLLLNGRRFAVRRARVWYGGMREDAQRSATTSLTFSNAMRTFYSFIYRPTLDTAREHRAVAYFIHRLKVEHEVADLFGPNLFAPVTRAIWRLAGRLRALQSGDLNFYLGLIGALLVIILGLTLR